MFPHTTRVALWVVAISLLIALFAPFTPLRQFVVGGLVGGIVTLAVIAVLELIYVFVRTTPRSTWKPGNPDQAEGRLHRNNPGEED